jgi:hypothetical protein
MQAQILIRFSQGQRRVGKCLALFTLPLTGSNQNLSLHLSEGNVDSDSHYSGKRMVSVRSNAIYYK